MKSQGGFTLIELIVVIVILGILAATALPKLAGVDDQAKIAVLDGGNAAMQSASTICYAATKATCAASVLTGTSYLSMDTNIKYPASVCSGTMTYGTSTTATKSFSITTCTAG